MNTQNLSKLFERALKTNNVALIEEISNLTEHGRAPQFGEIEIFGCAHKTVDNVHSHETGCI